jgi:hypothetical protein
VTPGYRLEEAAGAEAAVGAVRRGEEEGWVERVLEEVRREFSGLPVYVGVEEGYVYVKRTALPEILDVAPRLGGALT